MKNFKSFLGVYDIDDIDKIPFPKNKPSGVVLLTDILDTRKGMKRKKYNHWVSLYIDPVNEKEINYYDSFANPPPDNMMKRIKKQLIDIPYYLKFKHNMIKNQSVNSRNCGFFAMKFLIKRFKNEPFKLASGFSDVQQSENNIKAFKRELSKYTDEYKKYKFV